MMQASSIGRKTAVLFVFILLLLVLAIGGNTLNAAPLKGNNSNPRTPTQTDAFSSQDVYISAFDGSGNHNGQGLKTGYGGFMVYGSLDTSLAAFDLTGVSQTIDAVELVFTTTAVTADTHTMGTLTFTLYEAYDTWLDNIAGDTPFANVSDGTVIETITVSPMSIGDSITFNSAALATYFDDQRFIDNGGNDRVSLALQLTGDAGMDGGAATYNTFITFGDNENGTVGNRPQANFSFAAPGSCDTTIDGNTVYNSANDQAVRDAIGVASDGDLIKISGNCVSDANGDLATISGITLALQGGYTTTNWITSDPVTYPTILDSNNFGRVIGTDSPLTISNLTLQNGYVHGTGGGLNTSAAVTIDNIQILSNTSTLHGGALYATANVTINDSTLDNNQTATSSGNGGAIWMSGASSALVMDNTLVLNSKSFDFTITSDGPITVTNSLFQGNSVTDDISGFTTSSSGYVATTSFIENVSNGTGGTTGDIVVSIGGNAVIDDVSFLRNEIQNGGTVLYLKGTADVRNSQFISNTLSRAAGALNVAVTAKVTVSGSDFISNTLAANNGAAVNASGALTITNSTFEGNSAAANGGAIYSTGALIVGNVDFVNNGANQGGAISNSTGMLAITNSTFVDNTVAHSGGGIFTAGTAYIDESSFSGNSANLGGGVDTTSGSYTTIINSTFYSNTGTTEGGGIYIYDTGTLTATNVTLSNNASASGGGLKVFNASGTVHLINTVIANSVSGGDCVNNGTMATNNSNLIEDGTCSPAVSGDPMLGVLETTGLGGTAVFPLLDGSPAIDAGDTAAAPATDQRGLARPQGAAADIGAYELENAAALSLAKTAVDLNNAPLIVGDEILYTIIVTNELGTSQDSIVITDAIPANTTYVAGSASTTQGSVSGPDPLVANIGTLAAGASATFSFRVTVDAATVGATIQNSAQAASPDQPTPIEVGPIEPAGGGEVVASADLSIAQSIEFDFTITKFIIVVTNNGTSAAPSAVVSVTFPVEFEDVEWTCEGTNCPTASGTGNTLNETLGSFPSGDVVTYTVSTLIWQPVENAAEVISPVGVFDPDLSNNTSAQVSRYIIILPLIYNNASY